MNPATDWLFAIAGRSAEGLLVWGWQALVLLTCVWLVLKVCRVRSADLRHQIWLFSLIAVALLPLATEVARRFPAIRPASPLTEVIDAPRMVIDLAPQSSPQSDPVAASAKNPSQHDLQSSSLSSLARPLLFVIWLTGSIIVFVRLMNEQAGLRRTRKRAQPIGASDLKIPECQALTTGRVRLRLSSEIDSPMLCGMFHPAILLPADITEWTSPNERSAIIQHELAHVERLDPLVNLFQTALRVIFFFHPLVRFACRQIRLERELACDDRVVARGVNAATYAEGLLKVAERSLVSSTGHQLAFFSAKQILETRIEMILNSDRVRVGARHWKFTILSAGLIAVVAWLLIPGRVRPGLAQPSNKPTHKLQFAKAIGDNKAFDHLIEMAVRSPAAELRRLAAVRLTEFEGEGGTQAMVELYNETSDPEVKTMLIDTLARFSEIEPLMKIALADENAEYRVRALRRIKYLKANSESNDVKNWDVSSLGDKLNDYSPEFYPPPRPPSLMSAEDKALSSLHGHKGHESVFVLLTELAFAVMPHGTSFLERVIDDTYAGTMPDGDTRTKAQEIAEINRRDRQVTRVEFDEFHVSEKDGVGVATFLATVHIRTNGTHQQRYTVNFKKSAGQMKITAIDRRQANRSA